MRRNGVLFTDNSEVSHLSTWRRGKKPALAGFVFFVLAAGLYFYEIDHSEAPHDSTGGTGLPSRDSPTPTIFPVSAAPGSAISPVSVAPDSAISADPTSPDSALDALSRPPDLLVNVVPGKVTLVPIEAFSPEMREEMQRTANEVKTQGYFYLYAAEEEIGEKLNFMSNWFNYVTSMSEAEQKLEIKMDVLKGTPFEKLDLKGFTYDGEDGKKAIGVTRFFTYPRTGEVITLQEIDYAISSGGGELIYKDSVTHEVNGYPTSFGITQTKTGKAISTLSWSTETKTYILTMTGNVKKDGRDAYLFELARSIPGTRNSPGAPASPSAAPVGMADAAPREKKPSQDIPQSIPAQDLMSARFEIERKWIVPGQMKTVLLKDYPPDIREKIRDDLRNMKAKGYYAASPEEIDAKQMFLKNYRSHIFPMRRAKEKLNVELDDLTHSLFARFVLEGFIPEEMGENGKSVMAMRVFTDPKDHTVLILEEWDYVQGGGGGLLIAETKTNDIHGAHGELTILTDPAGRTISELTWSTERKSYALITAGNVVANGKKEEFIALAKSVPIPTKSGKVTK